MKWFSEVALVVSGAVLIATGIVTILLQVSDQRQTIGRPWLNYAPNTASASVTTGFNVTTRYVGIELVGFGCLLEMAGGAVARRKERNSN